MTHKAIAAIIIALVASIPFTNSAALQEPAIVSLKEEARLLGGRVNETVTVDSALAPLPMLVAEADLIVRGRVVRTATSLNRTETAVRTLFTLTPQRVLKDNLKVATSKRPGATAPLTFFEPGGTVHVDGLEITQTYNNATQPPLQTGDEIIGFFVQDDEPDILRFHHGPYGLLRVHGRKVTAANSRIARYRPIKHGAVDEVQAEIARLVQTPK